MCRRSEARHEKFHLSWSDVDGHGTCYVPVDLHEEVHEWIANYWKVKELMADNEELTRQRDALLAVIRRLVKTRGKPRREEWLTAEACRAATDAHAAALILLGECEKTDAHEGNRYA